MTKNENTPANVAAERKQKALDYHATPFPGKTGTALTKPCETQQELSLAYTPGVAAPVREIARDPELAYRYTNKGNLVAVVTDGTAVLGLGNVGPLAGKPVMEGKCVLFKRFAGLDAIDLEVAAPSPETFVETIVNLAPSFGGINLEDIASPHCFYIERALQSRLDIPVFHDDQHGTAIIIAAGLLNALSLQGKSLNQARIVCLGAGAAALASLRLLQTMGASIANIRVVDRKGVLHEGRDDLNEFKRVYAGPFRERTLTDAMIGADVMLGVSGPDLVNEDMVRSMAPKPIVFALSNPDPEISPDLANAVRADLIMATGRSDYPNQVNNVLGFPFIFRGALDAAAQALASLAHETVPDSVLQVYKREGMKFGPDYIIPTPFDPRLKDYVASAVAKAAVESGVARAPYPAHYPPIKPD